MCYLADDDRVGAVSNHHWHCSMPVHSCNKRLTPLQGYKQPLEADDIFHLADDDCVGAVSQDFRAQWHKELEKPNGPSLVRRAD